MRRRGWLILALATVLVAGGWYLASPLLAFRALGAAARAGDSAQLERLVDFPRVRASLKDQLSARLIGALRAGETEPGPLGALGALLGPRLVDSVVDVVVTPAGVAEIIRTGRAPAAQPAPPPAAAEPSMSEPPARHRRTRFAYQGLDHFRAVTTPSDTPDRPMGWLMERRGLFGWQLVAIELPRR